MSRDLGRRRTSIRHAAAALAAVACLVVAGMLVPLDEQRRSVGELANLAHAPAFGILAVLARRMLRRLWPDRPLRTALLAWLLVVLFGGLMEGLQSFSGRDASLEDLAADASGAAGFLVFEQAGRTEGTARAALRGLGISLILAPSLSPLHALYQLAVGR